MCWVFLGWSKISINYKKRDLTDLKTQANGIHFLNVVLKCLMTIETILNSIKLINDIKV